MRYTLAGEARSAAVLVEIDPHPDHAGFWVISVYHLFPGEDNGGFVELHGRGIRVDRPEVQAALRKSLLTAHDFRTDHAWQAEPAKNYPPYAVCEHRRAWSESLR
jgi:hypothetical protein